MSVSASNDLGLPGLLKDKCIDLELKGENKKEIITELVDLVAKSKKLVSKKEFLKTILERENLGSTGIGNGVAIPHAKSKAVRGFVLAFARKDKGLDFGALDGEKTYLFFTLASSEKEIGGHLKILSEISRVVKDKFIVDLLKKAKNKKEILKIIASAVR